MDHAEGLHHGGGHRQQPEAGCSLCRALTHRLPQCKRGLIFTLQFSVYSFYVRGGRVCIICLYCQEENLGMFNITLSDADMEALNKM